MPGESRLGQARLPAENPSLATQNAIVASMASNGAVLSPCGVYRYSLCRETGEVDNRMLLWVMLNPSTADAMKDDPTIRKVVGFTKRAGYGMACVVNLFAYRATKPADLRRVARERGRSFAEGVDNRAAVSIAAAMSDAIVCAWGAEPFAAEHGRKAYAFLRSRGLPVLCLGTTKDGAPLHPLMPSYEGHPLVKFDPAADDGAENGGDHG